VKKLKVAEYDYSEKAKLEHAQLVQVMDKLEDISGRQIHISEFSANRNKIINQEGAKMLFRVFSTSDIAKRKEHWADFKYFLKRRRVKFTFEDLMIAARVWIKANKK